MLSYPLSLGGEACGVTANCPFACFPARDPAIVLSWPSRDCEPAGVRGGDCMAEIGGDGRGEAPPDRLFS